MLAGRVEVDETYVGGKPRPGNTEPRKSGRGTKKTPVVALVERGGKARAFPIERVNAKTLKGAVRENVDRSAMILTDEWASYQGLGKEFKGGHFTVNHGQGEYWRGGAGTNTVESFFALLKRGVYGLVPPCFKEAPASVLRRVQLPLESSADNGRTPRCAEVRESG